MDLLEILEDRVSALVAEIRSLRKENAKLRENASAGLTALTQENMLLKRALNDEGRSKDATQKRMEKLLSSINEVVSDKQ